MSSISKKDIQNKTQPIYEIMDSIDDWPIKKWIFRGFIRKENTFAFFPIIFLFMRSKGQ